MIKMKLRKKTTLIFNGKWVSETFFFYEIFNKLSPIYLTSYLSNNTTPSLYSTRISYKRLSGIFHLEQKKLKLRFIHTALVSGTN